MAKTIGCEIPGVFSQQFGDRAKNATLDEHATMQFVGAMQPRQALDRHPIKDHASFLSERQPAGNPRCRDDFARQPGDLEGDIVKFLWPHVAQVLGGRRHRLLEHVAARAQWVEVGAGHGGTHATAMSVPRYAASSPLLGT